MIGYFEQKALDNLRNPDSFSLEVPNEFWGENHPANKRWKIKQEAAERASQERLEGPEPTPQDITNSFNTEDERRNNT